MADDRDQWADTLSAEPAAGWLAEEDAFDRKMLWRLGSWGTAAVAAVIVAVLANQSQMQHRWTRPPKRSALRQLQSLIECCRRTC